MINYSAVEEEYSVLAEKPIDVVSILMKYLSYWKWFLISLFICLTIAAVYLFYTLPQFRVETSILFKDDQRGGGASEITVFKEMGVIRQKNNVDNEIEILKKSLIVERVVRKLGIYVSYVELKPSKVGRITRLDRVMKFPKRKISIMYKNESPILFSIDENAVNNLNKTIIFDVLVTPSGAYEFSGKYNDQKFLIKASPSDTIVAFPFGSLRLIKQSTLPKENKYVRVMIEHPVNVAARYLNSLEIELTSKNSSVANLALTCPNGMLGRDFLEEYINTYNEEGIRDQLELADKTSQLIDDHLSKLSEELSSVETQVEDFKQSQGLTDISSQADVYTSQSASVGQMKVEAETQYAIVSNLNDYVQGKREHEQLIPANTGLNSEALTSQINTYNELVLERNRLSRIASSSNQSMIDLNNRIEATFNSVKSGLQNEKNNLEIQLRDISAMYYRNSAKIRAIPRQERVYFDIKRQQNIKEELFLYLLQKKEEKYMNMASVEPNTKLVDNIRILGAVSPNRRMVALIFFALGLIIPVVCIKLKELLRYQVSNKEELEGLTSVPILGEIPRVTHSEHVVIKENNNDNFSEMMRLLRANLLFVIDSKEKKVINMLSSISGEGKTFITINLAMSLALLEKKVLIVELDIRKPRLSDYLGIDNKKGITLYLSGNLSKEELVKPSGVHPNLSVITAGFVPPNPNELLAKPLLDELIRELRNDFDYVIIDTAPVGVVSDSFLLNRLVDVNLYVVRADYTPKKFIEDAARYRKEEKLTRLYFILNSVNMNAIAYRYGYGKKYGYGYA
ncbi:polysaccharide biosynthesis tyrosine autokinase [Petrimonas mucosa]|jgi:tyrosine-protein kinase Etk/Wzc|uniref:non-specific protein-tyrosine kinase n=3 Tax=Petrimonas mucosa TaxID=1642646 RepID=A0A1G4G8J6_9BACT|nr:polysaccharide biosynthesis tyrosine autokinase [Petrimonas mucosa]MDD3561214.1 polysaccharide biosynthesis tyrosine autokinase [Petrimonas mucosa]SCM58845.1 Tyrosine-protein kinase ptk [Petrimonas mucosa]HHT30817.1 polysaccharide biosynthesis tyrosine autokinase [Petrimonas mucosa]